MAKKRSADFVKWLHSQVRAFRARRFEQLDVEKLGCELEGVLARYRNEVGHRAKRLMLIVMRPYCQYADWDNLRSEWFLLLEVIKDSPSLAKTARSQVLRAYWLAKSEAGLYGEDPWPAKGPWRTLDGLLTAVRTRNREYLAFERSGDPDFGHCRPVPWKGSEGPASTRSRSDGGSGPMLARGRGPARRTAGRGKIDGPETQHLPGEGAP